MQTSPLVPTLEMMPLATVMPGVKLMVDAEGRLLPQG